VVQALSQVKMGYPKPKIETNEPRLKLEMGQPKPKFKNDQAWPKQALVEMIQVIEVVPEQIK